MEFFFFYLPIRPQLLDLLNNHEMSHLLCKLQAPSDNRNIVDGKLYKQLHLSTCANSLNLSLTFNCDGVPVFKSSSFSIWPILCIVNELPPAVRGDYVLMAGLWYGSGKPNINVFLEPFIEDCTRLTIDGFDWTSTETGVSVHCTASAVVGVCDAVARPLIQNFKQFNGHYGCGFCLDVGELVEKGHGHTTVYTSNKDMMLRSMTARGSLYCKM